MAVLYYSYDYEQDGKVRFFKLVCQDYTSCSKMADEIKRLSLAGIIEVPNLMLYNRKKYGYSLNGNAYDNGEVLSLGFKRCSFSTNNEKNWLRD